MEIETLTFIRDSDTIFIKLTDMPEVYINKSDGYFYSIDNKKLSNQIILTNLVKMYIANYENGKYKDIVWKRLSQQIY